MNVKGWAHLLEQARRRHRAGDAGGALEGYRRCLQRMPDHPQVLMLAAMAAAQAGHLEEAAAHARHAVSARDDAAARMTLGRVLLQAGELEEALDCFRHATGDAATAADAGFHAGQILHRLGRSAEAAQALETVLVSRPDHGPAWNQLGVIHLTQGRVTAAREAFQSSLRVRPRDPGTLANLAAACRRLGDDASSARALETALAIAPESVPVLAGLAALERGRGRLPEALAAWERCVEADPDRADSWAGLGSARQAAGDLEGAESALRRALALDPANPDAIAGLGEWFEWQGKSEAGLDALSQAPDGCHSAGMALVAGRLLRRLGRAEEARRRLEGAVPAAAQDKPLRRQFAFSLGDVCDELGDPEAAWQWYEEGNCLTPAVFDPSAHRRWLAHLRDLTPAASPDLEGEGITFIVGMPRSGTTLVEQILAAHPDVSAAGELPVLGRLVQAFDAEGTRPGSSDSGVPIGARYLESVAEYRQGAAMMTDKMPLNYQYLGIIRSVLPRARIIHCRRDLRDVALSCFFTDFIDPALGFATRLDWLADYALAYRAFMEGWSGRLGGRRLDIDYESLVTAPDLEIRRMLEFLELPWNPACLRFHAQDRFAATASHAQVRRPVYQTSVGRWRTYARHLAPLIERLEADD